jgi:integrase
MPCQLELRNVYLDAINHQRQEVLEGSRPELSQWLCPLKRPNASDRDVPMDERLFEDRFARYLRQIEVKKYAKPFHMLRHTYASILLMDLAVPLPAVSKMLGHSSIEITVDDYGHLLPDEPRREIMARLERWHVNSHETGHNNGHTLEDESA